MHPWFLVFPLSHPGAQIPSYQPELDTLMIWGNKLSLPEMELEKCLVSLLKYKIVHCLKITKMSHLNFRAKILIVELLILSLKVQILTLYCECKQTADTF